MPQLTLPSTSTRSRNSTFLRSGPTIIKPHSKKNSLPPYAHTDEFEYHFIPASKPSKYNKNLMVVLHGRGDSIKPFKHFDEELGFPEINYLLINGLRRWDGGFSWYAFAPNQARGILKARNKLTSMIDELALQGWRPENIFFLGFSSGGLISCDFGMNFDERLGGIICVSGYVYFFPRWRQRLPKAAFKTPWLVTHGRQDVDLVMEETHTDIKKMAAAGLPIQWCELNKEHVMDPEIELPMIRRWIKRNA